DNAWSDAKQQVVPERVAEIIENLVIRSESPADPTLLEQHRQKIDQMDEEIMNLFADRMKISQDIGRYKKENGIAILQSKRWEDILTHMAEKGEKVGLSAEFVERYLRAVHQESINHQNKVMNE
ncbi:MAG: chorismate mutase, partial [Cyclobacteriaceae bacterium]